jgi:hypothetical protein
LDLRVRRALEGHKESSSNCSGSGR